MTPRLYLDQEASLRAGKEIDLSPALARHVQVLRLQPGDSITLFDGRGGEWSADIVQMGGKQQVRIQVGDHVDVARELPWRVTLAVGVPANERMDALVEKATELGVAAIQPLQCARSVLRLAGERAERRQAHWQAVAVAAAEQSGRTVVPVIGPVMSLTTWLAGLASGGERRVLSLAASASPLATPSASDCSSDWRVLSGPEGGLDAQEEATAIEHGFHRASLGPRVLRADTAPLAALMLLAHLSAHSGTP